MSKDDTLTVWPGPQEWRIGYVIGYRDGQRAGYDQLVPLRDSLAAQVAQLQTQVGQTKSA